jgi:hypothetical protein
MQMPIIETKFDIICIWQIYNEILSWRIEIRMKIHVVSDSICNTLNLPLKNYKEWRPL